MSLDANRDDSKRTLSITEAAKLLGISRNAAYEAARKGQLPTLRIGRRILVSRSGLDRMLDEAGKPHDDG